MKKVSLLTCILLLAATCSSLVVAGAVFAGTVPNVIKFGIFPYKSPRTILGIFGPMAGKFENKLHQRVQIVTAPDAATFLERAKAGEYDIAMPCVACLPQLSSAGYKVVAKGTPDFHGSVIVRTDSDITDIKQFKGRKIAAIGTHSYAGYLFFKEQISQLGLSPEKDVDVHFLGKLDTIIYGVVNRQYDGGVIRLDTLENPAFAKVKDNLRVVSRSVAIPQFPFVVKGSVPAQTVALIREVLTSLSSTHADDREIMESLQIKEVIAAQDSDYDAILALIARTGELSY
ncbi:phosphate/phosphite/phosphonate ABC transporter substrate-binding protein [Thiovibrio sp. JS02]